MKSKRSRKDRARRSKTFVSCSKMAAKRFDESLLNHTATPVRLRIYDSSGVELVNTETHPTSIKHISTDEFSQMFESEEQDREEFFTEMINHFKISMGIPID